MHKKLLILLVVYSSISGSLSAQIDSEIEGKKNLFYVKSIINQINVGYQRSIIPAISLSFECGYQFRYLSDFHYKGSPFPIEMVYKNLGYSGISLRFSPDFHYAKNWTISPLIGYQNLFARKIIDDPGSFGGSSDASYSEYSQRVNEIIGQLLFYKQFEDIPVQFYFGLGIRFQHLTNYYTVEGRANQPIPSNRVDDYKITHFPSFIIGLKFIFVWF